MPGLDKLHHDKIKLATKVLFELPPSESLPVFKRLSIDNLKTLLEQLKADSAEGRGPSTTNSSLHKTSVTTAPQENDAVEHHVPIHKFKQQDPTIVASCHAANDTDEQTKNSLAGMNRFTRLTDDEIKEILKHCDTSFWAPALKNAPATIQQKIMNCMAPVAVGLLKVEIDKLEDISQMEEKIAREKIVHVAFQLATTGQIMLERRTNEAA